MIRAAPRRISMGHAVIKDDYRDREFGMNRVEEERLMLSSERLRVDNGDE